MREHFKDFNLIFGRWVLFLGKVFPVLMKFLGVLIDRIRKVEAYAKKELQRQMCQEICQ